jgi:tryptophanyl-tRNA synthetase
MGKSLGNAIYLSDSDEEITKKVMGAVTDSNKIKKDDPANPNVCMVYYYHKLLGSKNLETINFECKKGLRGCVSCKKELITELINFLEPMREKRKYYEEHPEEVEKILKDGISSARKQAGGVLDRVKKSMKLDYFKEQ